MEHRTIRDFFPELPTEQELRERIRKRHDLRVRFDSWTQCQQQEFLDMYTGKRGFKILYDSYFKEVMSPEYDVSRLESFLETIIGGPVKIMSLLPNDSVRLDDENTLLVTDIIVELQDRSIANVEVQKIGYMFPGARCSCYLSDMMLRQYRRVRGRKGVPFSYMDIQKVYLIVLYEKSPHELKCMPDAYIHRSQHIFDTGLQMDLLQRCILIPLDIFRKCMQNKAIETTQEAWLTFLGEEDPLRLAELFKAFPEFIEMYRILYSMNKDMVKAMEFYSKELKVMDQNTVQYMIDVQQTKIDQQQAELEQQQTRMLEQQAKMQEQEAELEQQQTKMLEQQVELKQQQTRMLEQRAKMQEQEAELEQQRSLIRQLQEKLQTQQK